ncbi:MAG TPA: hypothetical protein VLS90_19205 [Thermodesulfobacteriota bacterium]|nr:hypothetical protein [Thermodesulfobacteriota bacterium]
MERRAFLERLLSALAVGAVFLSGGCGKGNDKPPGFGNQEKLWNLAAGQGKTDEPVEPAYTKNTPAFFRDASLAKADPSFKPQVGGG